jgi:uncharacterized protein
MENYLMPLLGGALIGIAVSLMLYLNGRVTGVSGIVSGALARPKGDWGWRIFFIGGLVLGGLVLRLIYPYSLGNDLSRSTLVIVAAGLIVGVGTVMGSGCTSGHGICGISRLSPRSIVATLTFMGFGVLSATLFRLYVLGGA